MLVLDLFGRAGWAKKLLKLQWVLATGPVLFMALRRLPCHFMMVIRGFCQLCRDILHLEIGPKAPTRPQIDPDRIIFVYTLERLI
jgi:hypothetical protein